jgi:hypothetical protein
VVLAGRYLARVLLPGREVMRMRRPLQRLLQQSGREARRAARTLGFAGRALAERLAYRPREVVVVALLAGGLFGGLAVERWRARHPTTAERLEAEPPRLTNVAAAPLTPRPRPRAAAARCDPWPSRRTADQGLSTSARPRLDLNRATPRQLARLAGISWSLAARIVAARESFEGREPSGALEPPWPERFAGYRRRPPWRPTGEGGPEADGPAPFEFVEPPPASDPPPEPESGDDPPDPAPQ